MIIEAIVEFSPGHFSIKDVLSVNGQVVFDKCESCDKYILKGDNYYEWVDTVTCKDCGGCDKYHLLRKA